MMAARVEVCPPRCMIRHVMADEPSMSDDPTQGYFRKHGQWVHGTTRQAIREALGHELPVGFDSPMWTQRPLTPGPDWSRHNLSPSDSEAIEHVSVSGEVVRFCGACYRYWQEEAATRRR
jgi:hypothetical protein